MSGGAFDYKDNELYGISTMVAREIGEIEYGAYEYDSCRERDPRVVEYMKLICKDLNKLAWVLHSLDWYLSGDTGEEQFIKEYEKAYNISK